jgi:dihydrofolate reductase
MRKVVMWNLVSLDGFFEGASGGDLAWHADARGEELDRFSLEQARSADMLLFGRRTYEGMASYWADAEGEIADVMNGVRKMVFSRTLREVTWRNSVLATQPPQVEVGWLRNQPGSDILIFGSAELSATLMHHGMIDEYRLGVVPVVLGGGVPLFKARPEPMRMTLIEARPLTTGCVILSYRPA